MVRYWIYKLYLRARERYFKGVCFRNDSIEFVMAALTTQWSGKNLEILQPLRNPIFQEPSAHQVHVGLGEGKSNDVK